ncbi:DHA2 family efflux MFS transporter permease subunit [Paraconexibacter antarcticus]|uniref:DHA2 family efflux MFS transporter permease subunit n=1 Tax=Paraconexibacter antarcticus TaxID=2949664 RepID=A0ABY5DW09_9ACTN|nr:DHA2 family efflux MFS transporter permease subunit [Paraconexibacter antarcticus]UTI64830.1 DHA2 family efflux MFS transporter permease subunit [Paraconexibacter antarcticus]
MTTATASISSRIEPHVMRVAIVVVLGSIMSVLDTTIVNVALDTLGKDLHSPLADIQWVVTGYLLALAAIIPVTGWAARRFGPRNLYIVSLAVFTAGSALCALAWSTESLVAFRVLQGVGGGMTLPIGQMILARAAGPQQMGRVMSIVGVPTVLAPVLGPALGGLLLEHFGWQWIFLINVPVGIVAVSLALRLLPRDTAADLDRTVGLDVVGLALLAPGLSILTYGLAEAGTASSLGSPSVVVPVLAGLALVAAFVVRARGIASPLLDVRLFANRGFAAASATTFALGAALFGSMILMPLYFQTVRLESAVATGLLLAPQGLGVGAAMFISGRLTDRHGGGPVAVLGVMITTVATLPFVFIGASTSFLFIAAAMVVRGIGIGMAFMPAMTAAFAVLRPDQLPDATPQLNVVQRVGGSIGTAVLAVVLQHQTRGARSAADAAAGFGHTYWAVLGITALAVVPALYLVVVERRARAAQAFAGLESEARAGLGEAQVLEAAAL